MNDLIGVNINDKVAQIINTATFTHVSQYKIKSVLEKYPTPANTPNMCKPKMNTESWEVLPSFAWIRDVVWGCETDDSCGEVMVIWAEMFDRFHDCSVSNTIINALRSMVADKLWLSTALYTELYQKRRDSVKPHLMEEFKQLFCPTQKESNKLLFRDSLSDNVKRIGNSLKLTNLVSPHMAAQKTPRGRCFPRHLTAHSIEGGDSGGATGTSTGVHLDLRQKLRAHRTFSRYMHIFTSL